MILVDANILLYAEDSLSTGFHKFGYVCCVLRLLRRFTPRKDMVGVVIARAKPVAISIG